LRPSHERVRVTRPDGVRDTDSDVPSFTGTVWQCVCDSDADFDASSDSDALSKPCRSACMVCSDCKFPSRPRLPNRTRNRFHLNGCNLARRGHGGAVMMCDRHRAADRCNMLFTYCNMLANSVTLRDRYFRILSSIRTSKVNFVGQQAFPRATPDQRGYVVASSRGQPSEAISMI
jgi:hypothetical protein